MDEFVSCIVQEISLCDRDDDQARMMTEEGEMTSVEKGVNTKGRRSTDRRPLPFEVYTRRNLPSLPKPAAYG
ncbi:hypothetical protein CPT03_07105 [Pedobacter ginsengisoli]|uniref:Uncharacterized protein n=1 Tax=Pedobacter ginsengisoli TaxID=363852 RepID=A0A2D1U3S1_9SPHI|nr:hypothetical protein CPT03_07105 [Pedobacter ginsengisoli]